MTFNGRVPRLVFVRRLFEEVGSLSLLEAAQSCVDVGRRRELSQREPCQYRDYRNNRQTE